MELPELAPDTLTSLGVAAGLVVVGFLVLWLVVRSAVLSALTAHERRRRRGEDASPRNLRDRAGERAVASSQAAAPQTPPSPGPLDAEGRPIVSISSTGSLPVASPPAAVPAASGPEPSLAGMPAPSLAPPSGISPTPASPYGRTEPPVAAPARPSPQPAAAAAAAAALYRSHPAASLAEQPPPSAAPPAPPPVVAQPAPPQPAVQPVPQQAQLAPSVPPAPGGAPVVMSASDPSWGPPSAASANPYHVAGDAPVPAPYELPVTDPAAPRRY